MPKVDAKQIEPCPGPEKGIPCGKPADPAIQGYDKVWRCLGCNKVHAELVFKEAGEAPPNPGEAARMVALPPGSMFEKRRNAILGGIAAERIRGGTFTNPSPVAAREGEPADLKSHLAANKSTKASVPRETEEQRRARIVKKYTERKR